MFLGTPHRGSKLSPSVIGRIGARLAGLPRDVLAAAEDLTDDNPDLMVKNLPTSVDLLAPDAVRRLAWSPPNPVDTAAVAASLKEYGARPWQVELTATELTEALPPPAVTHE